MRHTPFALHTRFPTSMLALFLLLAPLAAHAVPLYARQTGFNCASCHTGGQFPELTQLGRQFKLLGYTMGTRQAIPLAGMLQGGWTKLNNHHGSADPGADFPDDKQWQLQQASLFTGGKILDNAGAFVQWTYDGVEHHSQLDNVDLRYARETGVGGKSLIYGVSLNNNPTVQDIFNATPAWRYPTAGPGGAFQGYGPSTMIDGTLAQSVAGIGAYIDWNNFLYVELSGYQTADGVFSLLRAGSDTTDNRYPVQGLNPYWRLALHGDTGRGSWEVGAYGINVDAYSDPTDSSSPTDRYVDRALDAQYQFTRGVNVVSAEATWIHETIDWHSGAVSSDVSNTSDTLNTRRIKAGYYYNNKIGGSAAYFNTTGSTDALLYADNTSAAPDTSGYIFELSYLPIEQLRLALQYTHYTKFNGAESDYDQSGTFVGRDAKDNDTLFLSAWVLF